MKEETKIAVSFLTALDDKTQTNSVKANHSASVKTSLGYKKVADRKSDLLKRFWKGELDSEEQTELIAKRKKILVMRKKVRANPNVKEASEVQRAVGKAVKKRLNVMREYHVEEGNYEPTEYGDEELPSGYTDEEDEEDEESSS